MLRKVFRLFFLFFIILVLSAVAAAVWLTQRDSLAALPPPQSKLKAEREQLMPQNRRHVEHITLHSKQLGNIGFAISLPDPLPEKKLPVLIVLGGLGTGENNIRYVKSAGDNAVIGYDWPMPVRFYSGASFLLQIPNLYQRLMSTPGQITSSLEWIKEQPWADSKRVSILGFSLGALAAPATQRLAEHNDHKIGWTILAYGGAPLGDLFAANPHMQPTWMRDMMAPIIDILLHALQPIQHLPHLKGQFLVLEGRDDALLPAKNRDALKNAVPQPKTIISFEGDHMGVGQNKMKLLQKIIDTSKAWLVRNGAVNPL